MIDTISTGSTQGGRDRCIAKWCQSFGYNSALNRDDDPGWVLRLLLPGVSMFCFSHADLWVKETTTPASGIGPLVGVRNGNG